MPNEYKVLKIDQLSRVSDLKGVEHYYRVQIKTKGGTVLSVDVNQEDYTDEKIAPILLAAAQNSDKILKLGG